MIKLPLYLFADVLSSAAAHCVYNKNQTPKNVIQRSFEMAVDYFPPPELQEGPKEQTLWFLEDNKEFLAPYFDDINRIISGLSLNKEHHVWNVFLSIIESHVQDRLSSTTPSFLLHISSSGKIEIKSIDSNQKWEWQKHFISYNIKNGRLYTQNEGAALIDIYAKRHLRMQNISSLKRPRYNQFVVDSTPPVVQSIEKHNKYLPSVFTNLTEKIANE